jgi:hypothetical protein
MKTRLQVMTWNLVFVLKLIPTFIGQNKEFFSCMCWRRMFCFSVHSPWEKNLKSFPFKVVLSRKQCSCDIINVRVYYRVTKLLISYAKQLQIIWQYLNISMLFVCPKRP